MYSDISNDKFSDCQEEFEQEVNGLEREYFESLETKEATLNETFGESPVIIGHHKTLSTLEETHFHTYNDTPNWPCSAYFCFKFYDLNSLILYVVYPRLPLSESNKLFTVHHIWREETIDHPPR